MIAMNLKNRFRLVIFSMVALLVSIAVIVAIGIRYTNLHIQQAIGMDKLVVNLYELQVLNSEYVETPSERVKQQWRIKYDQIRSKLIKQRSIPDDVKDALNGLQQIFERFISLPEAVPEMDASQKRLRKQVAMTLTLESQRVIDWASDISIKTKDGIVSHLMLVGAVIFAVMLVAALFVIAIMLITTRQILSSINRLKEGAEEIASGKIGFQVEQVGNDEIAMLAIAINQMSHGLMGSYEKLHEQTVQLETEMAERQMIYEALKIKTVELEEEIEVRKRAEEALRESEEKYRGIFENIQDVFYEVTIDGIILDVSPSIEKISKGQYHREDIIGKSLIDLYANSGEREVLLEALQKWGSVTDYEITLRNRDGSTVPCSISSKIQCDAQGSPVKIIGSMRNITERKQAEVALHVSQERYRTLVETTGDLIYTTDRKGFLTYMNPTLERTLGYAHHEWNGKTFAHIIAPECIDSVRDHFKRAMKGDSIPVYEVDLIRKDGARLSVEFNVVTIHDSDGKPSGRYGIGRDITDRNLAEAALSESEKRLQSIVDGSPIPAFVIGKDHRVVHWNKALEEISRIRPAEVLGTREHWKAFYNEERPCMADLLVDEAVELVPSWYSGKYSKHPLIEDAYEATDFFPAMGQDGRWLHFTAAAIRDSKGIIVAAIETLEDITERRQSEEALRESEERFRKLADSTWEGIVIHKEGIILDANESVFKMFGYSAEEAIGKSALEFLAPESIEPALQKLRESIDAPQLYL
jgi:PAS domain S-box-containing protein